MAALLNREQAPIAAGNLDALEANIPDDPFDRFYSYWEILNNLVNRLIEICQARRNDDRARLHYMASQFSPELCDELIRSEQMATFVHRTPFKCPEFDEHGVKMNGVLILKERQDKQDHACQRIDQQWYEAYLAGDESKRQALTLQLVDVVRVVRNNTAHGWKRRDNPENQMLVGDTAILLRMIVSSVLDRR